MTEEIESRYLLTKLHGARRLIHSTTRMFWANEDPLAINLLAQSADQLTANLFEKRFGSDLIWDSPWINKESRSQLLNIVRKAANFVKHADRDPDENLPVYDLQVQSEIATFYSILRFLELSNSLTCHMKLYLGYHNYRHPDHMSSPGIDLGIESLERQFASIIRSPPNFRTMWGEAAMRQDAYRAEKIADTSDSS